MATATTGKRRGGSPAGGAFAPAVRETIEYAARIHKRPRACPMSPTVIGDIGPAEAIRRMRSHHAGRIAPAGRGPARRGAGAMRHGVLRDPAAAARRGL